MAVLRFRKLVSVKFENDKTSFSHSNTYNGWGENYSNRFLFVTNTGICLKKWTFWYFCTVKLSMHWKFSVNKFNFLRDLTRNVDFKRFQTLFSFLTYKIATTALVRFLTLLAKYFELKIVPISHLVVATLCVCVFLLQK